MWYIYTMEYYSAIKNEIMPFGKIWMDLEIVKLSEVSQTGKEKYDMTSLIWNLKRNDTNKLTYKTEADSQTWRRNFWLPGWKGEMGEGLVRESGMHMYTLLCLKRITNKVLLYSTGKSVQCYVAAWMGGEFRGESV